MAYDGLKMLQRQLHGKPDVEQKFDDEKIINPKMKQFYAADTKIEPFYTGGKIVGLPGSRFACKCGASVKVVSTSETLIIKLEDTLSGNERAAVNVELESDTPRHTTSFGIVGSYECELDEIISFDACPSTNSLITSHKSQLLRLWNLHSGEVTKTVKSFHTVPISHTEIYKSESATIKRESAAPLTETGDFVWGDMDRLTWATVAGNSIKVWQSGGSQVSKLIRIDGVPSIGFIKWETTYGGNNRLFVAERNIYCIGQEFGSYAVTQILTGHYSQVTGLEWGSEDVMISAGRDKTIIIWNTGNSEIQKVKSLAFPGVIESTVLLNMKDLYIATLAGVIRHMDMETLSLTVEESLVLKDGEETIITLHPPIHQGFDTEEKNFLVSTHLCTLYEVTKSKSKKKASKSILSISKQFVGSLDEILDVTLWGDTHVAVANNTAVIKVYDLIIGSCQFLRGHKDIVLSLSSHKEYLVSASKDNCIIFWESGNTEPHRILKGHLASVTGVCFDPTKLRIYSVSEDNFLKSWTMETCLKSAVAHENEIHAVDCSSNATLVATASRDKTSKIWDADTLKLRGTLKGHKKSVWDVKFSLWDQLVMTSSADTTLKIWNLTSFECLKTLQGHQSSVLKAKFINLGLQAISAGSDGTLRLWDLRNSECLRVFENSDDKVWALDSTPNGSVIVTGSADAILTIWKDVTETKVKESLSRRKTLLETEQKLNNIIESGKWENAIQLAIELNRPFALLRVIRSIPQEKAHLLPPIIAELPMDRKKTLLDYTEKWNTNTRTSTEAQTLLNMILRSTPPKDLTSLKLSALLPYSEKHFMRLLKVEQNVCIVKFLSQEKRFGEPEDSVDFEPVDIKIEPSDEVIACS